MCLNLPLIISPENKCLTAQVICAFIVLEREKAAQQWFHSIAYCFESAFLKSLCKKQKLVELMAHRTQRLVSLKTATKDQKAQRIKPLKSGFISIILSPSFYYLSFCLSMSLYRLAFSNYS